MNNEELLKEIYKLFGTPVHTGNTVYEEIFELIWQSQIPPMNLMNISNELDKLFSEKSNE